MDDRPLTTFEQALLALIEEMFSKVGELCLQYGVTEYPSQAIERVFTQVVLEHQLRGELEELE